MAAAKARVAKIDSGPGAKRLETHVKTLAVRAAAVLPASDATLSGLSVTSPNVTGLKPMFDPATNVYELVDNDDTSASVTPTPAQSGATAEVKLGSTTYPLASGTANVPLSRGRNDITVQVTSSNTTQTSTYHAVVWRHAAPTPRIVSIAQAHTSIYGGATLTMTLADGSLPDYCDRSYYVNTRWASEFSGSFDPTTGLTTEVVTVPASADLSTGLADLVIQNHCYLLAGGETTSSVTAHDAVSFTDTYHVDSADIPASVTSGSIITLHGTDVPAYSDVTYWLQDASGGVRMYPAGYDGTTTARLYVPYGYGRTWFNGSGKRTLYVGRCGDLQQVQIAAIRPNSDGGAPDPSTCKVFLTKSINWVAPAPTDLSFTPSSGSLAGGATIRLRGRFLFSGIGEDSPTIKIGDQIASYSPVYVAAWDDGTFVERTEGYDTLNVTAPASVVSGPVQITATSLYGTTAARGTFTYSDKPTITSISPNSVANSGGSLITVRGTAFGTAGRPTVIINGTKSPFVTRISSTQLTAIVPPSSSTGPVGVSVASPQGGGVSSAATLGLVAPTTLPTVNKIAPAAGHVSDDVTVTGTGFSAAGTVGVSVDGQWAVVSASSSTSITFEVPATDTTGAKDVVIGTTTGAVTKAHAFTVLADDGITTVTPATVASYATGNATKIALDGAGFGTSGTVQVGSAAAVAYTATGAGTHIAGVSVPTGTAGSLPVVVTPKGAAAPLRSSVRVTGPTLTYVGSDPEVVAYTIPTAPGQYDRGATFEAATTVPTKMLVEGSGFGTGGTVKLGTSTVSTTNWTDTAITLVAPAHAAGQVSITVTPTHSTLSATYGPAVRYVVKAGVPPAIALITSVVDHSRAGRNEFDAINDVSDAFTLTGTNLRGTDPTKTRVVVSDGTNTFTVVPTSVTDTSLTFAAPRGFANAGWKDVQVTTDIGADHITYGLWYLSAGVQLTVSPYTGSCLRTSASGTGSVTYTPAVVTITNSGTSFGNAGTVSIDGVTITPTSYTSAQIVISMANLASNLTQPWGAKAILIAPTDTNLAPLQAGFTCGVTPTVTTKVNNSTAHLTVAAGTAYTLGYTTTGFIGSFSATAPGGYEYVSATDFDANGFLSNVHAGAPTGAGDYYVRVAVSRATFDTAPYLAFQAAPVRITITGTPITITPVSGHGASFTYRGQLGDGDFTDTASSTTDPITGVTYEYRDSVCASQDASAGWVDGLPKDVALSSTGCNGDGVTPSKWDVRVKSFEMSKTGTDRSIYYLATLPSTQISITAKNLTVAAVRVDKVYDGTTAATLGDLSVTGAVDGDDISLANPTVPATFASATAGVNKPVTLGEDLTLAGSAAGDYTLTNPHPSVVGTITKASAVLNLTASTSSVLLSEHTPVTITAVVTDSRTNTAVAGDANAAPVVLTSQTPRICAVSGTTVTATAAGTCTIAGTEAASANYQAATAASDPQSTTETLDIQVFPAPQAISVIADDLTVAVGDTIDPTSQVSGLFDGDSVDSVAYDFYSGATLLNAPPADPGTYKVVPKGGTLTAASTLAYSNPTSFTYVAGSLTITALPPTIDTVAPSSGLVTGGTSVTITGTRLDTVKSVRIGAVTLRAGDFTVNQDGTSLTFRTPAASSPGPVDLTLVAGTATADDVFTYLAPVAPDAPTQVSAVGGNQQLTVTFTPPASTGGAKITAYQVSTDGGHTWLTVSTRAGAHGTRTATITGVTNGVTYPLQVRAVNSAGSGAASATANATPVATHTAPGAPTRVNAIGRNEWIAVGFVPPTSDGGTPITEYQVSIDGGRSWHWLSTRRASHGTRTAKLPHVLNGVTYQVEVRAVNSTGPGAASMPNSALPNAPALGKVRHAPPSEVAIPRHPRSYHGQRVFTRAFNTSHNGTWAHPIPTLGTRQLTVGEAATLSKSSLFEFDSPVLTADGHAAVKLLASHLRLAHGVSCEGYTDYAGRAAHEKTLSANRAHAVCTWLVRYGAHVSFTTHGYGGARPVVIGGTARGRAGNRRVVVLVTK